MNGTGKKFDIAEEAKLVPKWSIVLGGMVFVALQLVWHVVIPHHRNPPPFEVRLFLGSFLSLIPVFWIMLIGYVNQDAKRRGMNRTLWTVLVILIPNAIGFVLYFLVRNPLQVPCPRCGTVVDPAFNYCPHCRQLLGRVCPGCGKPVRPGDVFCPYCGTEIRQTESTP